MGNAEIIAKGVYLIGGPNISRSDDATVFIIDFDGELVMIDAGAGRSSRILEKNIKDEGLDPKAITTLILTHCHIDHIGSAPYFRDSFGCRLLIHELDAEAVETGDPIRTAANWYETAFPPTRIDRRLEGDHEILPFGKEELHCLHTPGHTPGSIVVYLDRDGERILFGQDIHGPFMSSFGSNIGQWKESMNRLLALRADILCEGHFGIFRPAERVEQYIKRYLRQY
jgi:glyoxylase-like metal-dependent hydrolase (beta-lactamase superfamily II)